MPTNIIHKETLAILADVLLGCDIMRVLTYKYNCLVISIVSSGGVGLYEAFISDENRVIVRGALHGNKHLSWTNISIRVYDN